MTVDFRFSDCHLDGEGGHYVTTGPIDSFDAGRYRPLGLVANPFIVDGDRDTPALRLAIAAEANRLRAAIDRATHTGAADSILLEKSNELPEYYCLRAIATAERGLGLDEGMNVLHAYIPFFTMRLGRVRATLLSLGERLAYRSFDLTLAAYLERVLATPDATLGTYQAALDAGLNDLLPGLAADPQAAVASIFGEMVDERRPEMSGTPDTRLNRLPADVDETVPVPEVDDTVGSAPVEPTIFDAEVLERLSSDKQLEGGTEQAEQAPSDSPVYDYFIEYTRVHLSPVIARALDVYRLRGLDAMAYEFRVTKAPRKTLLALARFARARFSNIALIWDGFESWPAVPTDLRTSIVATLAEVAETLGGQATVVVALEPGQAPEIEEAFSSGTHVSWSFPHLRELSAPDVKLETQYVSDWIAAASIDDASGAVVEALAPVIAFAGDDVALFTDVAAAAVEKAADAGRMIEAADAEAAVAEARD